MTSRPSPLLRPRCPSFRPSASVSRGRCAAGEATLDLEVLDAAAPGLKQVDVYEAQPMRVRHAAGAHGPAARTGAQARGDLRFARPVRTGGLKAVGAAACEPARRHSSWRRRAGSPSWPRAVIRAPGLPARRGSPAPAGGELPGLLTVGDRRRRYQPQLDANNRSSASSSGTTPVQPGSAGGGFSELFHRPYFQNGAAPPGPLGARRVDAGRHRSGFRGLLHGGRDCIGSGHSNPWRRSAARAQPHRCSRADWRSSTSGCG